MLDPEAISSLSENEKLSFLEIAAASERPGDAEGAFVRLARDPSPRVRRLAVAGLRECPGLRHAPFLIEIARRDPSLEVRLEAVAALSAYVYEHIIAGDLDRAGFAPIQSFLVRTVRDESAPVELRGEALRSVALDDSNEVCDLIGWAYAHPDPVIRRAAVGAMGASAIERWTPHVVTELYAEDPAMRAEAVRAASRACLEDATPRLRNLAVSGDPEIRLEAIEALAYTGGPGALETLELCAASDDPAVHEAADRAIGIYRSYEDIESHNPDEGESPDPLDTPFA